MSPSGVRIQPVWSRESAVCGLLATVENYDALFRDHARSPHNANTFKPIYESATEGPVTCFRADRTWTAARQGCEVEDASGVMIYSS